MRTEWIIKIRFTTPTSRDTGATLQGFRKVVLFTCDRRISIHFVCFCTFMSVTIMIDSGTKLNHKFVILSQISHVSHKDSNFNYTFSSSFLLRIPGLWSSFGFCSLTSSFCPCLSSKLLICQKCSSLRSRKAWGLVYVAARRITHNVTQVQVQVLWGQVQVQVQVL